MGLFGKLKKMLNGRQVQDEDDDIDYAEDYEEEETGDLAGYYEPEDLDQAPDYVFLKALHAVAQNDIQTIRQYLKFQVNYVLCKDWEDNTLIHRAALFARPEIIDALLGAGAELNVRSQGQTPLHLAVSTNALWAQSNKKCSAEEHQQAQLATVKLLLERGADPNIPNVQGEAALHTAARMGNVALAELLLKQGAAIDMLTEAVDDNQAQAGRSPLLLAARHNKSKRMLKFLLDQGANPNLQDQSPNYSALHYIAVTPRFDDLKKELLLAELADLLLSHQADPNLASSEKSQQTALHFAARQNHPELVKILLKHGANPNQAAAKDVTPISLAAKAGYVDIVILLLEAGVDINQSYALFHAAKCKTSTAVLELLVERGGDINFPDEHGVTPVFAAISANSLVNFKFFLERGIDKSLHPPGLTLSQHAFANWGAIEAKGEKANAEDREVAKEIITLLGGFD